MTTEELWKSDIDSSARTAVIYVTFSIFTIKVPQIQALSPYEIMFVNEGFSENFSNIMINSRADPDII